MYAVDNSTIINFAELNAKENNLSNITFIKDKVEDITLPTKVDIIISEWMGYFLLFEGMLDSVIMARDKFLKPDGILAPSNASIKISLFEDEDYMFDKHQFWDHVYGFSMLPMKDNIMKEGQIETLSKEAVISNVVSIKV